MKAFIHFWLFVSLCLLPVQGQGLLSLAGSPPAPGGGGGGMVAQDNFDAYGTPGGYIALGDEPNWVDMASPQAIAGFNSAGNTRVHNYSASPSDGVVRGCRHTATLTGNHYSQVEWVTIGGTAYFLGVAVRMQSGADSFYALVGNANAVYLFRVIAGASTGIGTGGVTHAAGDKIKLEANGTGSGTRLTAYEDTGSGWAVITGLSSIDPGGTYLDGGFAGLAGQNDTAGLTTADFWECGNN